MSKRSTPDDETSPKDERMIGMEPNCFDQSLSSLTFDVLVFHTRECLLRLVPSHS